MTAGMLPIRSLSMTDDYISDDYMSDDYIRDDYLGDDHISGMMPIGSLSNDYIGDDYISDDFIRDDYISDMLLIRSLSMISSSIPTFWVSRRAADTKPLMRK